MEKLKFLIGTSGWTYDHWGGTFYPKDLPRSKWFDYYATKFQSVEINATFYRTFLANTYQKWYKQAPAEFKYVIKVHRFITHRKFLKEVKTAIKRCDTSAHLLGKKLGLILLQLPPQMPYDLKRLHKALSAFKNPSKVAVEFRHHKWLTKDTKQLLQELNTVFCTSDAPEIELIDWVTAKTAYIRLHGSNLSYSTCYSKTELQKIAKLAKKMTTAGAEQIYIFFNNDATGYAPRNALQLKQLLQL